MSKVEEVAAACRQAVEDAGKLERSVSFEEMSFLVARAAIEAMRDPTEAMQKAIPPQDYTIQHYHGTGHHATFPTLGSGPLQVWHSMIDAALNEQEQG